MKRPEPRPRLAPTAIDALYLSPHLDDAVLSCGGTIHQRTARGERVVVLTVCAGHPPAGGVSPYARSLHARWASSAGTPARSAGRAMLSRRRSEDRSALKLLGARVEHWDVPDAIYRRGPHPGAWLYEGDEGIFGDLSPAEDSLVRDLAERLSRQPGITADTRLLLPLTVGHHVDHQLVRRAAERWCDRRGNCAYYEDYPYAADAAAVRAAVPADGVWRDEVIPLAADDLVAKIDAIAAYASQITTFWADRAAMVAAVTAYALSCGVGDAPAERSWWHAPGT